MNISEEVKDTIISAVLSTCALKMVDFLFLYLSKRMERQEGQAIAVQEKNHRHAVQLQKSVEQEHDDTYQVAQDLSRLRTIKMDSHHKIQTKQLFDLSLENEICVEATLHFYHNEMGLMEEALAQGLSLNHSSKKLFNLFAMLYLSRGNQLVALDFLQKSLNVDATQTDVFILHQLLKKDINPIQLYPEKEISGNSDPLIEAFYFYVCGNYFLQKTKPAYAVSFFEAAIYRITRHNPYNIFLILLYLKCSQAYLALQDNKIIYQICLPLEQHETTIELVRYPWEQAATRLPESEQRVIDQRKTVFKIADREPILKNYLRRSIACLERMPFLFSSYGMNFPSYEELQRKLNLQLTSEVDYGGAMCLLPSLINDLYLAQSSKLARQKLQTVHAHNRSAYFSRTFAASYLMDTSFNHGSGLMQIFFLSFKEKTITQSSLAITRLIMKLYFSSLMTQRAPLIIYDPKSRSIQHQSLSPWVNILNVTLVNIIPVLFEAYYFDNTQSVSGNVINAMIEMVLLELPNYQAYLEAVKRIKNEMQEDCSCVVLGKIVSGMVLKIAKRFSLQLLCSMVALEKLEVALPPINSKKLLTATVIIAVLDGIFNAAFSKEKCHCARLTLLESARILLGYFGLGAFYEVTKKPKFTSLSNAFSFFYQTTSSLLKSAICSPAFRPMV